MTAVNPRHIKGARERAGFTRKRRTTAIKTFGHACEMSAKTPTGHMEMTPSGPAVIKHMTLGNIILEAYGLLRPDYNAWLNYRKRRAITGHICDENRAEEIFKHMPDFFRQNTAPAKAAAGGQTV